MGESPMHADSPNHHLKALVDTPFPRALSRDYDPVTTPFDPSSSSADDEYISELDSAQLSIIHTTFVWSLDEPDALIKPERDDIFCIFSLHFHHTPVGYIVLSSLRSAHVAPFFVARTQKKKHFRPQTNQRKKEEEEKTKKEI